MFPMEKEKMAKNLAKINYVVLKALLPYIILAKLQEGQATVPTIILEIHKKFEIMLSPGTLYGVIYSMERKGYVKRNEASIFSCRKSWIT